MAHVSDRHLDPGDVTWSRPTVYVHALAANKRPVGFAPWPEEPPKPKKRKRKKPK